MVRVNGCCCFSLKTGSLIIATLGWIGTICKLFGLAGSAAYRPAQEDRYGSNYESNYGSSYDRHEDSNVIAQTLGYRIGYAVVALICCILLVVGIYKKSSNYFIPWLIVTCLEAVTVTVVTGIIFVFIFIVPHPGGVVFGIVFAILLCASALTWYFWIVVYSHYHEVKSGVVNVVTGTGGNVYYSPTSTNPPAYDKDRTQMA